MNYLSLFLLIYDQASTNSGNCWLNSENNASQGIVPGFLQIISTQF